MRYDKFIETLNQWAHLSPCRLEESEGIIRRLAYLPAIPLTCIAMKRPDLF